VRLALSLFSCIFFSCAPRLASGKPSYLPRPFFFEKTIPSYRLVIIFSRGIDSVPESILENGTTTPIKGRFHCSSHPALVGKNSQPICWLYGLVRADTLADFPFLVFHRRRFPSPIILHIVSFSDPSFGSLFLARCLCPIPTSPPSSACIVRFHIPVILLGHSSCSSRHYTTTFFGIYLCCPTFPPLFHLSTPPLQAYSFVYSH
jgi:hypothetical protein